LAKTKKQKMYDTSSMCGHNYVDGNCELMCDDYVSQVDGMCYLMAFESTHRKVAIAELGLLPFACTFNVYYNRSGKSASVHVVPPTTPGGVLHIQRDSIPSQSQTVVNLGECSECKFFFKSYSNSLRPPKITECPRFCCASSSCYREYSLIRFTLYSNKIGSSISIRNLILNESTATEYELREPSLYVSEAPMPNANYDITYDKTTSLVKLTLNEYTAEFQRHDQKLKAFVHDFVSSCWQDKTDAKLLNLGIEGPVGLLSPDYIIKETRCVLELATCGTDNQKSIINSYSDKVAKYHGDLERVKAKFFVLVVSPQKVFTNLTISQNMVDVLTQRMRMVQPMKAKLLEVLGEDVTNDEYNELERLAKLMFSSIPECPILEDKHKYVSEEIKECSTNLTSSESISAARILLTQFESTKNVHSASKEDLESYMSKFTSENTRSDLKRVSNVPILLPGKDSGDIDGCLDGNDTLKRMWVEALT